MKYIFHRPDPVAVVQPTPQRDVFAFSGQYTAENYKERIAAERKGIASLTVQEKRQLQAFKTLHQSELLGVHPCKKCRKHCFNKPDVVCYWCKNKKRTIATKPITHRQ